MNISVVGLGKLGAVLAAVALLLWEFACPFTVRFLKWKLCLGDRSRSATASLLVPVAILSLWYAYHYSRTGYIFGNPDFFHYNVQATLSPLRILLAWLIRIWQTFGYMHLIVLTLLMTWAMTRPALKDGEVERQRIEVPVQGIFGLLILTYATAMAVVGGAVLARYMLPVVPLMIIIAVSTLWRRIRMWPLLIALTDREHRSVLHTLGIAARQIVLNPLIMSACAGALAAGLHIRLPVAIDNTLLFLQNAAAPTALFVLGVTVALRPFDRVPWEVPGVIAVKLLIHPLIVADDEAVDVRLGERHGSAGGDGQ